MTKPTEAMIEEAARRMVDVWCYADRGSPDWNAEWQRRKDQYLKQAAAALSIPSKDLQHTEGVEATALDVAALAQEIRRVDGDYPLNHTKLAEALMPFLSAALSIPSNDLQHTEGMKAERICTDAAMNQWEKSLKRPDLAEKDRVRGAIEAYKRQAFAFASLSPLKVEGPSVKAEGDIVERLRNMADQRHRDRGHDAVDDALREAAAEIERFRSERSYIIGFNDGWEGAHEQQPGDDRPFGSTLPLPLEAGWTKVPEDMPLDLLRSINIDNQVLAYENGRYYNAWFEFEASEGGWFWTDEADSEPNPSYYRPLPAAPSSTSGGGEE